MFHGQTAQLFSVPFGSTPSLELERAEEARRVVDRRRKAPGYNQGRADVVNHVMHEAIHESGWKKLVVIPFLRRVLRETCEELEAAD